MRNRVFHYVISAHNRFSNSAGCPFIGSSGVAEIWGNDIIVSLGSYLRLNEIHRGTHMHGLGHNLSFGHGGNDTNGEYSCVHTSVMNYRYELAGWGNSTVSPSRRYNYSRGRCDAIGTSCANTCVNIGDDLRPKYCVPANERSPKFGCTGVPHAAGCDCDISEWSAMNLMFQGSISANGASALRTGEQWALVQARIEWLRAQGLQEGRDFVVDPRNWKLYAVER